MTDYVISEEQLNEIIQYAFCRDGHAVTIQNEVAKHPLSEHDAEERGRVLDEAAKIIQHEWMCSLPEIVYILDCLRGEP